MLDSDSPGELRFPQTPPLTNSSSPLPSPSPTGVCSSVGIVWLNCYLETASPLGVDPARTLLFFQSHEPGPLLCLLPRDMVAVYSGISVPVCPGGERERGGRKETEGRCHEKEPVQRCNWYLSFFRKHFLLTEVQQMSQGPACFITTLTVIWFIILSLCGLHFEEAFFLFFLSLWSLEF